MVYPIVFIHMNAAFADLCEQNLSRRRTGWSDGSTKNDFDEGEHCLIPVSYQQSVLVSFNHEH